MNTRATVCLLALTGVCACKPQGGDDPQGPRHPTGPTHEPMDVRVINASRVQEFRGASPTDIVWTGTEAALVFTSAGSLMERLWVGRMDGNGKLLEQRQVELDREVSGHVYPRWVDGAIASVYNTGLTDHWIRVSLDGKVLGIEQIPEGQDQHVSSHKGDMHPTGRFLMSSFFGDVEQGKTNPVQLDFFDGNAKLAGSLPVDCDFVGDIVATNWGYAFACEGSFSIHDPNARTTKILGVRDLKIAWTFAGLPSGRKLSLGSDGERILLVHDTEEENGTHYPVTTQVLDREGRAEAAPVITEGRAPEPRAPMIWTGKEFATYDEGQLFMRYASDGRPLGVWEVEPRCNRDFRITGLTWTGVAYLIVGSWGWDGCYHMTEEPITDEDRLHPLPLGLTWDPAADELEPPDDDS